MSSPIVGQCEKTLESEQPEHNASTECCGCTNSSSCCQVPVDSSVESTKICSSLCDHSTKALCDNKNFNSTDSTSTSTLSNLESINLTPESQASSTVNKFLQLNRKFTLPANVDLAQCVILYIGPDGLFQSALMMSLNKCRFIAYDPVMKVLASDAWNINRRLMKRYYMVEKARDAARVGILVGTLGVKDYLQSIRRLTDLIRRAGKKCYRFAVGKLNEAKLANFAEIDVFVLIACPENSLIDSSEMFRPIVTPFEMELACDTTRQWTGSYEVDFRQLLPGGTNYYERQDSGKESDSAVMDVSLVTGRVRQIGLDEENSSAAQYNSSGPIVQQEGRIIVHNSAGDFLRSRSWQGLDPQLGETAVSKAVEGTTGIAAGYTHEPKS